MDLDDIWMIELTIYFIAFLVKLGLAAIPASIAKKKGYSGAAFYFFGLFMFAAAVIVAAVLQDKRQQFYGYPQNGYPQNYNAQNGYPPQYHHTKQDTDFQ